jgi:hypothetical protein
VFNAQCGPREHAGCRLGHSSVRSKYVRFYQRVRVFGVILRFIEGSWKVCCRLVSGFFGPRLRFILDLVQFHLISFGLVQECSGYTLVQDVVQIPSRFICLTCVENVDFLLEKSLEWDLSFWMASLNFRNAFDKIEHESLFRDLREQGMPGAYITLLARLYHNQTTRWCAQSCIFQRGFGGCYVIMEAKSRRLTWSTRTFDKCNICWQPPFICDVFSVFHMVEILCEERANVGW